MASVESNRQGSMILQSDMVSCVSLFKMSCIDRMMFTKRTFANSITWPLTRRATPGSTSRMVSGHD